MKEKPNFPYNFLSNSANYRMMLPPFQDSNKLYIQNRLVNYRCIAFKKLFLYQNFVMFCNPSTPLLDVCKTAYPYHSLNSMMLFHKHPFTLNCPLGTLQRDRSNHTKDRYLV